MRIEDFTPRTAAGTKTYRRNPNPKQSGLGDTPNRRRNKKKHKLFFAEAKGRNAKARNVPAEACPYRDPALKELWLSGHGG